MIQLWFDSLIRFNNIYIYQLAVALHRFVDFENIVQYFLLIYIKMRHCDTT